MKPAVVRRLYTRWLQLVHGRRGLRTSINGEPMRLAPRARSVAKWSADRSTRVYEPELWQLLLDQLRPDDHFVDVGANVGLYSIAGARRVPNGQVWAVEPDPQNAELLRSHVAMNDVGDRVTVVEAAAGDDDGTIEFSALGIPQSSVRDLWESGRGARRVALVRLDAAIERADVMKIDVEGYEGQVLAGSTSLLGDDARKPRLILVEVHPELLTRAGWSIDRIRGLLLQHGYDVVDVEARHAQDHWLARRQSSDTSASSKT